MTRRTLLQAVPALAASSLRARIPDRAVLLSFDDAVKSHRTFVAPLLQKLGFKATFFVTHLWMDDTANFMSWREIAELHQMGFEIGNHAWTHNNYSEPRMAPRLASELQLTEYELARVGVPRPMSFAWCGNNFGPESLKVLRERGYLFARRGLPPEARYGTLDVGMAWDPARHDPLLIPTTGDAYPSWTVQQLDRVLEKSAPGRIIVLQFHGVPDLAHPWVHTPPEQFERYMHVLRERSFQTLTFRDLASFVDPSSPPADPVAKMRWPRPRNGKLLFPPEAQETREDLAYWIGNMSCHGYTEAEQAAVCGMSAAEFASARNVLPSTAPLGAPAILPYPGGRSARSGRLDEATSPLRGAKFSVFLPWDRRSYIVIDLPQAVRCDAGLIFQAHTHEPTIWNLRNVLVDNLDWDRLPDGSLQSGWALPNAIVFGATVRMENARARMEFSLTNFSDRAVSSIEVPICVMLKEARGFTPISDRNVTLKAPVAGIKSADGSRAILTSWAPQVRVRMDPEIPCIYSDAVLPECARGDTVRATGALWFSERGEVAE